MESLNYSDKYWNYSYVGKMPIKKVLVLAVYILAVFSCALSAQNDSVDSDADTQTQSSAKSASQDTQLQKDATINNHFNEIFTEFVDESGMVNYSSLRRKRSKLFSVIRRIEDLKIAEYNTWTSEEQTAFWINTYNICTLHLIIENYPIQPSRLKLIFYPASSIMQIKNAWTQNFFNIMGREYTLKEIEQNLPLLYDDPKVFLALSYASCSSAPLRNEAYLGHKLEIQLEDQARRFAAMPQTFTTDDNEKIIYITDVFNWYKKSFKQVYSTNTRFRTRSEDIRAYFNFLSQYLPENDRYILDKTEYDVEFARYDWRLNETKEEITPQNNNAN